MGFFNDLFGGGAQERAAEANRQVAQQYGQDAQGYLTTGYNTGVTNLNKGIDAFKPLGDLATKYNAGGDLYLDALGVNGATGNARASGAFTNSPGYSEGIDAGLTGINRRRALGGMVDSGNADIDALTFAQNSQNQQYKDWLANLQATGNAGIGLTGSVAQGQAGGYTNLANLAGQYAQNQTGVAGNVASGMTGANNLQAQGEAQGMQNLLGAGLSLAGMAIGGPMGGGLGSALGGMFSGGTPTGSTFGGYGAGGYGSGMMGGIRYPAV